MIEKTVINDIKIRPVKKPYIDPSKILGYEYFKSPYAQVFISSRKESGKSTIINNVVKNSVSKYTTVIFFVNTIERDHTYVDLLKYLDKKDIPHVEYHTFKGEDGEDLLRSTYELMKEETEKIKQMEKEEEKRR